MTNPNALTARAESPAELRPRELEHLRRENARLAQELKRKDWAAIKTNEGIKILYKEIERKNRKLEKLVTKFMQSEARFRLALKSSPITVMNQDRNLRYTWVYNSRLHYTPKQILGKRDSDLFSEEAAEQLTRLKTKVLQTGVGAHDELKLSAGSRKRFYDLTVEPLRDSKRRIIGVTSAAVDVTERKKVEVLLRHNEKVQKEFVANVSHDLRTPIAAIQGFAETLIRGKLKDSKNSIRFLKIISKNSDRLKMLVEDLLTASLLESGKEILQPERIDLRHALRECKSEMAALAARSKVSIQIHVPARTEVWIDRGHLDKIFQNLLTNAIKFNRPGGKIRVKTRLQKKRVLVSVQDTGIGIPRKARNNIFRRFYRGLKVQVHGIAGTGLGLHIVKRIVASNRGAIWVRSKEGQGSTFYFTLPRPK